MKDVERSDEVQYFEIKLDELDLLLLDDDTKKAYMKLRRQEPAMLPVDKDGRLEAFILHKAVDIYFREYPDTSQAKESIAEDTPDGSTKETGTSKGHRPQYWLRTDDSQTKQCVDENP